MLGALSFLNDIKRRVFTLFKSQILFFASSFCIFCFSVLLYRHNVHGVPRSVLPLLWYPYYLNCNFLATMFLSDKIFYAYADNDDDDEENSD